MKMSSKVFSCRVILTAGAIGLAGSPLLSGCTAIAEVDAAASTAVGATKAAVGVTSTAVKGTAAVAGAVIPDTNDEKKGKKK